jgi:phenylacetic acid degradation operon negative regulatory protein
VSSFPFDDLLPDLDSGSVRLPRRQVGGSPQGLAVTLLADYTLRTRAWLPSAAIVALLAESHVTAGGARAAISRLSRRDVLESGSQGRNTFYRLSEPAAAALVAGGRKVVRFAAQAESWDGNWTLIAFSLPRDGGAERRALRSRLRWQGYAPLYDGLWVAPHGRPERAAVAWADMSDGALTVFRAHSFHVAGAAGRDPLDAWDLDGIAERYEQFMRRWSPLLHRVRSGDVGGAEALRERTEVMETYRRFLMLDPRLPMRLMPAGWPRQRARELFAAVYDGLAEPAVAHVRSTAARFGDLGSGVDTHSVAELLRSGWPGLASAAEPAGHS